MGVAFGIFLGLAGSLCINTGNNLQSLGMHQEDVKGGGDEEEPPNLCENKTWVTGTVVFVAGALLNFASYGFAPQSTLASLESIQFVSNLFFGWWLLKKKVTRRMMYGTGLTVGGTVLAVIFSSKEAAEIEDVDDLVNLWNNDLWISYVVLLGASAIALQMGYKRLGQKEKKEENVMAVIYSVLSALFGTLSVVFAKLLAKLVELQADGINIFAAWYTYITIISWLILMAFWLYRLNEALSLYNPLFIIPLLQANFIFFAIVSGGIYFREFDYMPKLNWIGFVFGIICMFVGIALLVPPKTSSPPSPRKPKPVLDRQSSGIKKGCCKGGALKLLMTGPARMYEQEFFEKAQQEIYLKKIGELQSVKNVGDKRKTDLLQKLYQNVVVADGMIESEQTIKSIMNSKKLLNTLEKDEAKILMQKWKEGNKNFKQNDNEIGKMLSAIEITEQNDTEKNENVGVKNHTKKETSTIETYEKPESEPKVEVYVVAEGMMENEKKIKSIMNSKKLPNTLEKDEAKDLMKSKGGEENFKQNDVEIDEMRSAIEITEQNDTEKNENVGVKNHTKKETSTIETDEKVESEPKVEV